MTVPFAVTTYRYQGNGVTTVFAYSNRLLTSADVRVDILTRATDALVETLTLDTDYTVTIVSNSLANITITNPAKIPSALQDILLELEIDIDQTRSFPRADSLPAADIERGLDKLTLIAQKQNDNKELSLRFPSADIGKNAELPPALTRASKYLAFDANGDVVASAGTDTITSPYGLSLVQADDAADARTILGAVSTSQISFFTPASASGPASIDLAEDTDNGTNRVRIIAPAALANNVDAELPSLSGRILNTSDVITRRVGTQFDRSSTILGNVTDLSVDVQAGVAYAFSVVLYTTSLNTAGICAGIGGTCTATSIVYDGYVLTGGATGNGAARATALGTSNPTLTSVTAGTIFINGTILVNAAGTLTVQFGQNAFNATVSSVLVNSSFTVQRIA